VYTSNKGSGKAQLETQQLAVSQDRGRTWTRYSGNPVLDLHMSDFRDPDAQWNEQTHSWLMAVALPNEHKVAFYSSPDLKQWTQVSSFGPAAATGGQWECPNLVRVPSAAPDQPAVWALKVGINPGGLQGGSGEQYFLGSFDGKTFTPTTDHGAHGWSDYGKDSYCAISYNHLPPGEKPTLIGWMDNWQYADKLPTSPWRGQMTLPRRLTYLRDADGLALVETPLTEPLRDGAGQPLHLRASDKGNHLTLASTPFELQLSFQRTGAHHLGLRLASDSTHYTELGFDLDRHVLFLDRTHADEIFLPNYKARTEAPLAPNRPLNLRLVADRNSLEVFAQDGTLAMTNLTFPKEITLRLQLSPDASSNAEATGHLWPLRPIWSGPKDAAHTRSRTP
ncbi:MAG: glycoside hydrolase family 32 protein, partial [Rhodospirillales bacterium]|nr:glycoside hydrolase family 32 protein [Acetobacter sp.]